MIMRPPRSTRPNTLFPYPTLFRSLLRPGVLAGEDLRAPADLRPVAGALCDQLRVCARPGLPAAAAVDGSGLSRLLRERKSTRLNSRHLCASRLPSSACKKNDKKHIITPVTLTRLICITHIDR